MSTFSTCLSKLVAVNLVLMALDCSFVAAADTESKYTCKGIVETKILYKGELINKTGFAPARDFFSYIDPQSQGSSSSTTYIDKAQITINVQMDEVNETYKSKQERYIG